MANKGEARLVYMVIGVAIALIVDSYVGISTMF
jgi:hypothetical protein